MKIVKRLRTFVQQVADRADLNEKENGLLHDIVLGISESGSVRLSKIAGVVDKDQDVPLIRTEQRLSKGLMAENSGLNRLMAGYLPAVAPVSRQQPYLIIDGSQNTHLHGKAYEFLDLVQDRSLPKKPNVPGYWTVNIEVCDAQRRHLPLYHDVFSTVDPAYQALGAGAWQTQFQRGIETVLPYLAPNVTGLIDRGFDSVRDLMYFRARLPRHVVRMRRTRNVEIGDMDNPTVINIGKLADQVEMKYEVDVEYVDKSSHKIKTFRHPFTWIPVRVPGVEGTYYLLVVGGTQDEDWLLLSSFRPHNVAEAEEIIQMFVRRWGIEETIRCYKQCTGAEKVMVRKLVSIRRLLVMAMIATGLQAMWTFRNSRLAKRLIGSVKAFIKEVPFVYYRLWQGVQQELVKSG